MQATSRRTVRTLTVLYGQATKWRTALMPMVGAFFTTQRSKLTGGSQGYFSKPHHFFRHHQKELEDSVSAQPAVKVIVLSCSIPDLSVRFDPYFSIRDALTVPAPSCDAINETSEIGR